MVGDGAATLVARAFAAAGVDAARRRARARFWRSTTSGCCVHTRPYPGMPRSARRRCAARAAARRAHEQAARRRRARFSTGSISRGIFRAGRDRSAATARFRASRIPPDCGTSRRAPASRRDETLLVGDSLVDWRTARAAGALICLARYGFGFETVPVRATSHQTDWVIDRPADLLDAVRNRYVELDRTVGLRCMLRRSQPFHTEFRPTIDGIAIAEMTWL